MPGADTHGTVGHKQGGDAEAGDGGGFHPAGAGEEGGLLLNGHVGEEVSDTGVDGAGGVLIDGLCGGLGERGGEGGGEEKREGEDSASHEEVSGRRKRHAGCRKRWYRMGAGRDKPIVLRFVRGRSSGW